MAPPQTIGEACGIIVEQLQNFSDTDKINDLRSAIADFIEVQKNMQRVSIRLLTRAGREDHQMQPIVEQTDAQTYTETLRSLSGPTQNVFTAVNHQALLERMIRCLDNEDLGGLRYAAAKLKWVLHIEHGHV